MIQDNPKTLIKNVGAFISVGGWTGSQYFSTNVQPGNQDGFVQAIVSMVKQYNLNGVDFESVFMLQISLFVLIAFIVGSIPTNREWVVT